MSEQAIKYLQENKNKFSKEILVKILKETGYTDEDIKNSADFVYDIKKPLQKRKQVKIYSNKKEKTKDFWLGVLYAFLLGIIPVLGWIVGIVLMVRYYFKRKFVFYGMIAYVILTFFITRFLIFGSLRYF